MATPILPRPLPKHFYSLDALRGLAALSVVFWHWPHFLHRGTKLSSFQPEQLPLFTVFKYFYTDGWRAVELFFCLSGFIFTWLYAERIQRRKISLREFSLLRFSRLYPLHILTLVVVAAGQFYMLRRHGDFFVYPFNDPYHLGLQTLFASNWGFERGFSFNGPVWSVSVEVLLYAVFFLVCRLNLCRWWHTPFLVLGGYVSFRVCPPLVARGLFSFFIGSAAFYLFDFWRRHNPSRTALFGLGVVLAGLWVAIPRAMPQALLDEVYLPHFAGKGLAFHGKDLGAVLLGVASRFAWELILFPLTIITLALWEVRRGSLGKRLSFLGQISYSSYLLHFPLQLIVMAVVLECAGTNRIFYHPLSLVGFFPVLIALSLGSYRFFERPCQSRLRGARGSSAAS